MGCVGLVLFLVWLYIAAQVIWVLLYALCHGVRYVWQCRPHLFPPSAWWRHGAGGYGFDRVGRRCVWWNGGRIEPKLRWVL